MILRKRESGQTIVIVAVSLFVLVAMAALIIDGGYAFLNRRNAQTAADAAALAGAYERCVNGGSSASIEATIVQYALIENNGTSVESLDGTSVVVPDPVNPANFVNGEGEVEVIVSWTSDSFFAKVFGQETTTVRATASAGCFPPGAVDSVIPVAWSCRPPAGTDPPSDSSDCEYKSIPWHVMEDIISTVDADPSDALDFDGAYGTLLYHGDTESEVAADYLNGVGDIQLYVIMDSAPLADDTLCTKIDGTLEEFCDLDGDGRVDWTNSERSWLLLDNTLNDAQLDDIVNGAEISMDFPGWYAGRGGNIVDVYKDAVKNVEDRPTLIPVYEHGMICPDSTDPSIDCVKYVAGDHVEDFGNNPETYFRVITVAEFYPTCISYHKECPGKQAIIDYLNANEHENEAKAYENDLSIEGYFVTGWVASSTTVGSGASNIDLGVYVISLTE